MKYFAASFFILFISGCQQLNSLTAEQEPEINTPTVLKNEYIASELEDDDLVFVDVALPHPFYNAQEKAQQQNSSDKPVFVNLWSRIQSQLTFDIPDNRRLQIQRSWYARHPDYMNRVAKRAEPFLYYIVEEIEKRNMPMELVLLPVVESAFDPFAYSHGRASGLWQFVPDTGKRFGLQQNWWYDGRRDVVKATQAALDYLTFLNKKFDGDWLLALAAYNSGEGRVARAVRKNFKAGENTDFWSLELPKETDAYVPKLLALADIIKRPNDFNLKLYPIANVAVLEQVEAPAQIDLAKAAKLADMHVNELHALNPGYNRWSTAPNGPHRFILPIEKANLFNKAIKDLDVSELVSWSRYQVKSGDSIGKIAQQYKVTIDAIKSANKLKGNIIRVGEHLLIPTASQSPESYELSFNQRVNSVQQKARGKQKIDYKVKSGDTFWDISQAHNVNVRTLAKWNSMAPGDPIYPGQNLVIWKNNEGVIASTPTNSPTIKKVRYKVRNGDSLARIAAKFKVSITDIESWNKINRKRYLQPGQTLKLFIDVTNI